MTLLANYENERNDFRQLLLRECDKRILLLEGASGSGKTSLIKDCLKEVNKEKTLVVPIQLRQSAVSVPEIFHRFGSIIGWDNLTHFIEQVNIFWQMPTINVENNTMVGRNQIEVALYGETPIDKVYRRAALTGAWFDDLATYENHVLIVLDTYEDATTEVCDWIDGPFLARVAHTPNLRVLLAGQHVPNENNIEWGSCCQKRNLAGVYNASDWMPIVEEMNLTINASEPHDWLAGICYALKGQPGEIRKVLESLSTQDFVAV